MKAFETARLIVRQLEAEDLPAIYAICSDPELMRYMGDGQPLTEEQTARWIEVSQLNYVDHGYGCMAVIDKASGEFIGYCGLVHAPDHSEPEIIYCLAKPYWGQGLAGEVARGMIDFGLNQCHLPSILATIYPQNSASVRVVEKLGFTFLGEKLEEDGTAVLYYQISQ